MKAAHALSLRVSRGSRVKGTAGVSSGSPNRLRAMFSEAAQADKSKRAPNWNKMVLKRNSQVLKTDDPSNGL